MGFDIPKKYGLLGVEEIWDFPANQLGGWENVWVSAEYGLSRSWVRTESTVSGI